MKGCLLGHIVGQEQGFDEGSGAVTLEALGQQIASDSATRGSRMGAGIHRYPRGKGLVETMGGGGWTSLTGKW